MLAITCHAIDDLSIQPCPSQASYFVAYTWCTSQTTVSAFCARHAQGALDLSAYLGAHLRDARQISRAEYRRRMTAARQAYRATFGEPSREADPRRSQAA